MRNLVISIALTALTVFPANAFEVEDMRLFGSENASKTLRVISTTDIDVFAPIIDEFLNANENVAVEYVVASSTELMRAISEEDAQFDVALSSAMDLQTKLANDGFALSYESFETQNLPLWARWQDNLFAFSEEPAAIVISKSAFHGIEIPKTRQELIKILRENQELFRGKIGTYDVRSSGLGYLFATQDARTSETYWRLTEVMGNLDAKLYCCSSDMINDVADGRIAVAYNVLGSYASARIDLHENIEIILPLDFTTVMLRTALIANSSQDVEMAGLFIDHLLRFAWGASAPENNPFRISPSLSDNSGNYLSRIKLGPGLLVYLDRFKRDGFVEEWENAVFQP